MLRRFVPWCLFALPWAAGCASSVSPLPVGPGGTAELTVRVWSTAVQAGVAGRGTLREVGGEGRASFDTSGLEDVSQTLPGLRAGLWEVRVTERWEGRRLRRADGVARVYLEPGTRELVVPVAIDRVEETGLAPERGQLWPSKRADGSPVRDAGQGDGVLVGRPTPPRER